MRQVKDGQCNTSYTNSAGTITRVVYETFNAGAMATTGQTVCVGGTPSQIGNASAATGGNGVYTYSWYKDGDTTPISGATANSYTPPAADAMAAGAHTYTRKVRDGACSTTPVQSTGSWVLTVIADPTVTIQAAQTVCYNTDGSALTATVTGGSGANTYTWKWGASTACSDGSSTTTANTLATGNLTASRYYTVMCTQATSGCTSTYSGTVLKTVGAQFKPGAIATTGQAICIGGAVNAITGATDASGGDGSITYQWREGATTLTTDAASYTPSDYNTTAGTHTFTRWAHDGTCNTGWVQSAGSWVLTVHAAFTPGAIATTGQAICIGGTPNAISSSTAASGGGGNITYEWRSNGTAIGNTNAADYTPAAYNKTAGANTFTRWAKDGACSTTFVQSTGQWVLNVRAVFNAGSINTSSATTQVNNAPNITVANVSSATGGDNSITYQWRRSGTSSATLTGSTTTYALYTDAANYSTAGTYIFTRYAKDKTCNTSFVASSGQYTLTVTTSPTAYITAGSLTLSNALRTVVPGCTATNSLSSNSTPPAQYVDYTMSYGFYYNGTCVKNNKSLLCPSPWRLPTRTDTEALITWSGCCNLYNAFGTKGYWNINNLVETNAAGYIWVENGASDLGSLRWVMNDTYWYYMSDASGIQIRCVK
jgi:hypothetical protein